MEDNIEQNYHASDDEQLLTVDESSPATDKPAGKDLSPAEVADYAAKFEKLGVLNDELAALKAKLADVKGTSATVAELKAAFNKLEEISQHQNNLLISMNNIFG